MRIAWIIPGGVDRSGRERVIPVLLWLIEELATRHDLHVFAQRQYPQPCKYALLGATIHNLGNVSGFWGASFVHQITTLLAVLRSYGPFDVIHGFWADTSGFLATLLGKWLGLPVIVSLAGGELVALPEINYGSQRSLRGRLPVKLALQWADAVTAASEYMCKLARPYGVSPIEIPLGVHPKWFIDNTARLDSPPWRLLAVASLNRVKDQRTLLLALNRVLSVEPNIHLDIIGEDTLQGETQRLCETLGLNPVVRFHGFLPNDEVQSYFHRAHLLLTPSRHDAGPLVMLEAAASGLPSIGTYATGHAVDWHPKQACAIPPGDDQALAAAVLSLLRNSQQRAAIGQAAQNWAKAHDSHWTAQQFEKLYMSFQKETKRNVIVD